MHASIVGVGAAQPGMKKGARPGVPLGKTIRMTPAVYLKTSISLFAGAGAGLGVVPGVELLFDRGAAGAADLLLTGSAVSPV